MALNEKYFVTGDLETYFVDKDSGLPLANGYISFFRDVARNTPKTVFTLSGSPPNYTYVPLPNPVPLNAVGLPTDAGNNPVIIYYYPFDADGNLDLYFAEVFNSGNIAQKSIEAWPNITAASNPVLNDFPLQNQLSNAQFSQVFINENQSTVYSVSAATNEIFAFAPNWDFIISGTGTVTVQRIAIAGNDNVPTSPPYVLDITLSAGITACYLRQRMQVNSGLWASTADQEIFLAGTLIAINENAGTSGIQMFYVESTGGSPIAIVDDSFDNSGYKVLTGTTATSIPLSTNTDSGNDGYIDIYLSFLVASHVRISSIQVVPTLNEAGGDIIQYDLNSSNREEAFMGDYYIPRLNARPAASLLVGWDFPVNPFQFAASGNIGATAAYICDQTIALRGASGAVAYARNTVTNGLQLTTAGTNDAFYLMQYLSGADAKKILGTPLSVNVNAYRTSVSSDVTMRVYLFRADSGSSIPTLPTSIGTVATSGVFTLTAVGWTQIPRSGLDTPTAILPHVATNPDINDTTNDMGFTGWELTDSTQIGDTDKFAIVATFAYTDAGTVITVNSISLIPNAIPSRPAPKPLSDVIRECAYYYEKSYDQGVYAGAVSSNGAVVVEQSYSQSGGHINALALNMPVRYQNIKRLAVTPTFYALDGTSGDVTMSFQQTSASLGTSDVAVSGNWTLSNNGMNGFSLAPVDVSTILAFKTPNIGTQVFGVSAQFHFIADARLGVV